MIASYLLSLREGLEAALIVGVLLVTLKKLDRTNYQSSIWFGAGLAVILSLIIGLLINLVGASFEGRTEEIFEGITMILAAVILTWVILWMRKQAKVIDKKLEANVKDAIIKDNKAALFSLAFLAVIREGIELAFFLTAVSMDSSGVQILIGAALGIASVIVLAILLFKSLVRLNITKFFQFTSFILILFAAGLVAHGVHEFNEAGIIPSVIEHVWDINHILDENSTIGELLKSLVGFNGNPSLTEVIAYIMYFIVLWVSSIIMSRKGQKLAATST
jgi:high-affinity iron transporter